MDVIYTIQGLDIVDAFCRCYSIHRSSHSLYLGSNVIAIEPLEVCGVVRETCGIPLLALREEAYV